MPKLNKLVFNTSLLTASSLLLRAIGLAFQVWLAGRIGAAGIGLFQLVMSVGLLAMTLAASGIRFAATRLVSEELGMSRGGGISRAVWRCLAYAFLFGIAALAALFSAAEPIGFLWIGDARTVLSLKLFAFELPFISLSSVIAGYFTATGRVYKNAINQVGEQLVRIALVALLLAGTPGGDIEQSCCAIVIAGVIAEVFSFTLNALMYAYDRRKHGRPGESGKNLTGRMLGVALPYAASAYARTSLSTLEQMLVPRGLKASGLSADAALSGYGVIQGMAFPILFFPSCVLTALAELLVPNLTEAQVRGQTEYIARVVGGLLEKTLVYAIGCAGLLAVFSDSLALAVYKSAEAGAYLRVFSALVPVIYLDMVTDGMLKGLGQQLYSMAVNIADAAISVALVYFLLPKYALAGYIGIICFTECFNFVLSIIRLHKITELRIRIKSVLTPLFCVAAAGQAALLLINITGFDASASVPAALLAALAGALAYAALIKLTGVIEPNPETISAG